MFDLGARSDATTDAIRPAGEHVTPDRLIDLGARSDATTDAIRPAGEHVTPDRLIAQVSPRFAADKCDADADSRDGRVATTSAFFNPAESSVSIRSHRSWQCAGRSTISVETSAMRATRLKQAHPINRSRHALGRRVACRRRSSSRIAVRRSRPRVARNDSMASSPRQNGQLPTRSAGGHAPDLGGGAHAEDRGDRLHDASLPPRWSAFLLEVGGPESARSIGRTCSACWPTGSSGTCGRPSPLLFRPRPGGGRAAAPLNPRSARLRLAKAGRKRTDDHLPVHRTLLADLGTDRQRSPRAAPLSERRRRSNALRALGGDGSHYRTL